MFVGVCCCCHDVCKYHEHPNWEEWGTTCGASREEYCELLTKFCVDDADDIDDCIDEAVGQHENQDSKMDGCTKEVDGNGAGSEPTNTGNDIEDTETDTNGKRKAHDDREEEEVSAKKHKQEEADS